MTRRRALRVAVVGSRRFPSLGDVERYIYSLPRDTVIVSGGAIGVDKAAEVAARTGGLKVCIYLPDYDHDGAFAPLLRNEKIVADCDRLVAFWDGKSRGTMHTVGLATRAGKPVEIRRARR